MREGAAPKPTEEQKERSAMTTEELLHRLIKMFSFRGDTALDPFMGSGTTSLAAKNLERNSVGYEINPEFIEIAKQKLNTRQPDIKSEPFTHDKAVGYLTEKIKREHSSEMPIFRTSEYPTNYSCRIVPDDDQYGDSVQFSIINRSGTLVNALSPVTRTALTA